MSRRLLDQAVINGKIPNELRKVTQKVKLRTIREESVFPRTCKSKDFAFFQCSYRADSSCNLPFMISCSTSANHFRALDFLDGDLVRQSLA